MSYSNIHSANPSSLPSDYAAIYRHAAARANGEDASIMEEDETGEESIEPVRPHKPTVARDEENKLPAWAGGPTERTPLVPRIEEDVDGEDIEQTSLGRQYWEETKILVKYTLPVVG